MALGVLLSTECPIFIESMDVQLLTLEEVTIYLQRWQRELPQEVQPLLDLGRAQTATNTGWFPGGTLDLGRMQATGNAKQFPESSLDVGAQVVICMNTLVFYG